MQLAIVVAMIEVLLVILVVLQHQREPFTDGPLLVYRASLVCAALSLAFITGALLLTVPESRGVLLVAFLAAVGVLTWRSIRSHGPRIGPLQAETQAAEQPATQPVPPAQPAALRYKVRTAPHVAQPSPVAETAPRSARVRKIMSMEESYGN